MTITLNHTIVPAHEKEASARFFAQIFGVKYEGPMSHFAPVRVNDELTLDFDNADSFEHHHYAFHVSDEEFDAIGVRGEVKGVGRGRDIAAEEAPRELRLREILIGCVQPLEG